MKVLFVNPPNTTTLHVTESGKYVEENIGNQFFPFSRIPFEIMAELNDFKEIEKDILLLDFEWYKNPNMPKEKLIDLVVKKKPDVILITIIAQANADSIDWLTTKIKERLSKSLIILGGQAIRHLQEKIFKFCPNIDFALIENTNGNLKKLIKHLINSKKYKIENIEGLIYKKKGKVKKNNLISLPKPKDLSPEIMYDKYKNKIFEIVKFVESKGAYVLGTIEFSKGCPFNCNFCAAKSTYLEKNILNVINEIEYLYRLGIHKFYITDLTFGVNPRSRNEILKQLKKFKKKHTNFGFRCITRVDLITKEFVKQLLEAGCYEVGVGIECNEDTVLNLMNKKISINNNLKALDILGESGISFKLFLIEGYPGSSSFSSRKTFELLNYLEDKKYNYFIQPALNRDIIPSQKRFREMERKGILRRGTLSQLDFRHDCRKFGWDTNRSIRAICILMLAYPQQN